MVIIWSSRARRNFVALLAYTKARSPSGAKRIGARIEECVAGLAQLPFQGSLLPKSLRRLEVTRTPYLLVFRVDGDEIRIVAILHHARKRRS